MPGMRLAWLAGICAMAAWAQTPAGRPTDQPPAEEVAKLKTGPALPYKVAAGWPELPKGYNFGEASGVDVDKDRNVWVFNRGHWPVIQLDRTRQDAAGVDGGDAAGAVVARIARGAGREHLVRGRGRARGHQTQSRGARPDGARQSPGHMQGTPMHGMRSTGRPTSTSWRTATCWSRTGTSIRAWWSSIRRASSSGSSGPREPGDGEFNLVHDVAVDSKGRIYVGDRSNERIQVFDGSASFWRSGPASGRRGASITTPRKRRSTRATASTTGF